jgi:glycyl-tRNA synthetase beta chain
MKKTAQIGTADFLLELGCEEIPARMIPKAAAELKVILEKYLSSLNLIEGDAIETFGGPRRLTARAKAVRLRQPDTVREVIGPPKTVAYDAHGKPTRAAESFAEKQGLKASDLRVVTTPRGEYVAARQVTPGRSARELLAETLPTAILDIPWPRRMYWTSAKGPQFIRPIRWILALLGGKVIPFTLGPVASGNFTYGHRFLSRGRIGIRNSSEYVAKLRKNFVLASPEERRSKLKREMEACVAGTGLRVHEDEELLELVTYLNEYPTVIRGDFDPGFLELPGEILITVMRDHQKYFAVEKKSGALAPHFLAVVNLDRDRGGQVRAGHERVLRARFADARFFWESDQKCRLADNLPRLAQVTYESRLGSYEAKVERMKLLASWLATQWAEMGVSGADPATATRVAELSKCDLVTGMVGEFPELQGIVGGLYARAQGEPEEVAWGVYDHYRPVGLEDPIPRNLAGCAVSMADKLDALAGCFAVGLIPSGSSDPFALRRAALGVVKIILERKLPVALAATLHTTAGILAVKPPRIEVTPETTARIIEFLLERAKFVFRERLGFAYDEVNAAMAAGGDDLLDVLRRLEALKAIRKTKNFEPLAVAFKRIRKILEKSGPAEEWQMDAVRPELFSEEAERKLLEEFQRVAGEASRLKSAARYREALQVIAGLRPAVDRFFDDVLVMAEDEQVRKNRLTLLAGLLREFSTIADFSEIVAEEKR